MALKSLMKIPCINAGFEQVETDARGRMIRHLEQINPVAGPSIDGKLQY